MPVVNANILPVAHTHDFSHAFALACGFLEAYKKGYLDKFLGFLEAYKKVSWMYIRKEYPLRL